MFLEFTIDGKVVYYQVPDFHTVKATHLDNPNPKGEAKRVSGGDYSGLIVDASIVASIQELRKSISDAGVGDALQGGISAAVQALQKKAGKGVTIKE